VLEAENPRGLSEAASAAVWRHAPGLENGFAGGGGDRGGRGGRGELPPGGAANEAREEDGSDASSAAECGGESAGGEPGRGSGGRCSPVSLIFFPSGTAAQRLWRRSQLAMGCLRLTCEVTAGHQAAPQADLRKVAPRRCSSLTSLLVRFAGD
jgi:hypothetical protein